MTNVKWGTLQVGRTLMSETYTVSHQVNATTGEQSVSLSGTEVSPRLFTDAQCTALVEDIIGMKDQTVPVTFSSKTNHSGYYKVKDAGAIHTKLQEGTLVEWNLSLTRLGTENSVDQESRVAPVLRVNDFSLTGQRWLAPPVNHYAFYSGSTTPSGSVDRVSTEGTVKVWLGVPSGINPQWGCAPADYVKGRARVSIAGVERSGTRFRIDPSATTAWEIQNGIFKAEYVAAATMRLSTWNGTTWEAKDWYISVGGTNILAWESITVLRNDMEMVVVRFIDSLSPGRTLVDVTLRRGARFIECYVQTTTSATIATHVVTNETSTDNTASGGYVVATADDALGNRLVCGSARTCTGSTTGGVSKAATRTFGFFLGIVHNGAAAVAGDLATDIRNQYIGAMSETVAAVSR